MLGTRLRSLTRTSRSLTLSRLIVVSGSPDVPCLRQHVAGAGKAELRLAVRNDDPGREFLSHLLAGRGREPAEDLDVVDRAVLHAVEAQRVVAGGDDAVELGLAAHEGAVGDVALGRDLLVEAQAGAGRVRLGLNLDLGDPEGDEPAQLLGALDDRRKPGEAETGLEGGERLLVLVVAVVVAGR